MNARHLALPALLATLALVPGAAQARTSHDCPKRAGTLSVKPLGRAWHQAGSLYACTTVYGRAPRLRRLGPWKPGTTVVFDGVDAVWTVPLVRAGVRSDRVWAASAQTGRRWLSGTRLIPASAGAPAGEARVQRLLGRDEGAAWVTRSGQVVLALHAPESDPEAVGALPAPLQADRALLLIGTWPAAAPDALAASARLEELEGDGDECGGVNPYRLTVQPDAAGPRVGALWSGGWSRPDCG
jgi:hypothetical protein